MPEKHETNADLPGRPLSAEEAAELATQVAELARSGLPLGTGLQALADELPRGRLARVVRGIAKQLDRGVALDAALEAHRSRLPAHLRGLILAGVRSGRLPEVLEEFIDLKRGQTELRRRVWLSLAYPVVLLVMLTGVFLFLQFGVIDMYTQVFLDFEVSLPPLTQFFLTTVGPGTGALTVWTVLLLAVIFLLPMISGPAELSRLLYGIPLVGPLWRWGRLVQCSRLMALLLDQAVPLPEALRLTAAGLPDAYLASGCRRVAEDVEAGRSLGESFASQPQFPASMIPLVNWGEQTSALADALRAVAEMFEGRTRSQETFVISVFVPIVFMVVASFVATFFVAMMMPLMQLIVQLS